MHTWFQNLWKEDKARMKLTWKNWPWFRGSIRRNYESKYSMSYEMCGGIQGPRFDIDFFAGDCSDGLSFTFGLVFVRIYLTFYGILPRKWTKDRTQARETGFYFFQNSFIFYIWKLEHESKSDGSHAIVDVYYHFPWDWKHHRTSVFTEDGLMVKRSDGEYKPPYSDKRKVYVESYQYLLNSGVIQVRIATFYVDEMEWRRKFLKWTPMFNKVKRSIWVDFDDEVGEGTGSWKGGTMGCGYNLNPGETPTECLRRMEKNRKFKR